MRLQAADGVDGRILCEIVLGILTIDRFNCRRLPGKGGVLGHFDNVVCRWSDLLSARDMGGIQHTVAVHLGILDTIGGDGDDADRTAERKCIENAEV